MRASAPTAPIASFRVFFLETLAEDFHKADGDEEAAEKLAQQLHFEVCGKQRAGHGGGASGERGGDDGLPADLPVFGMEDQGTDGGGQEIEQIDALRGFLLHGEDSGHPDHEQAPPPMPKPESTPQTSPANTAMRKFSI